MHHSFSSPYRQAADKLIEVTASSNDSIEARFDNFTKSSLSLGRLVLEEWHRDPTNVHHGLHAASTLACSPAIISIIEGQITNKTAQEVDQNLVILSGFILRNRLTENGSPRLRGELSEFAILSLLWWSFAQGFDRDNSFALPATSSQDSGNSYGLRDGVDIVTKIRGKKLGLQIKSSRRKVNEIYAPNIKVISPKQLTDKPKVTKDIIKNIAVGRRSILLQQYKALEKLLFPVKQQGRFNPSAYRSLKEVK